MNITDATSTTPYAFVTPQETPAQIRTHLQQLQQALGNGNLAGAQQSYATLQQTLGTGQEQFGNSVAGNSSFSSIGQALQTGDLNAAKNALAAFIQLPQGTGTNTSAPPSTPPSPGSNSTFHVIA